jgi:hypothetical protein
MAPAPVALALGFGLPFFTVLSEKEFQIDSPPWLIFKNILSLSSAGVEQINRSL